VTVKELNIGDVFRVVGFDGHFRKITANVVERFRRPNDTTVGWFYQQYNLYYFKGKEIEVVERADASDIRRFENTLILKGSEVTLKYAGPWQIYRCTPGEAFTEFVLTGSSFGASTSRSLNEASAIAFSITLGSKHLGRPGGSDVFAYKGRVYGRATKKEVLGKSAMGGYKLVRNIDGAKRMVIAGVLTIPDEFALYDIIMEHFGPDSLPQKH
jgi:hypothetical protein